jgi:glucuronokinase
MTIETRAFARAGLLGNPSDQYYGKIIAVSVKNFSARVSLEESSELRIETSARDAEVYRDKREFTERLDLYGYYGGTRLIKAALKTFFDHCRSLDIPLRPENFSLRYNSDIPRQVGMAGSSALIVAAMRALMEFYAVRIREEVLPTLVLQAELKELGINAGYMDRVIQVYEGCVYMNLERGLVEQKGFGEYERLDTSLLPPLYLAYKPDLGKVSGTVHNELRTAYDRGDAAAIRTIEEIAGLAEEGRRGYCQGDFSAWPDLMNRNFDLRARVMKISPSNREIVQAARRCGASANFAGSGGSIVGIYKDEEMFICLSRGLGRIGARVIKPKVA